jgi:hypothetical protein
MEEGDQVVAIAKLLERDEDASNGTSNPAGDSGTAIAPVESTPETPESPSNDDGTTEE